MQSEYRILPLTALIKQITEGRSSELFSAMFLISYAQRFVSDRLTGNSFALIPKKAKPLSYQCEEHLYMVAPPTKLISLLNALLALCRMIHTI